MDADLDRRIKRGKELADRMNAKTILDHMPKLYYVKDFGMDRYRVGRTDWPGDTFELIPRAEFDAFRKIYERLSMPLLDLTDED